MLARCLKSGGTEELACPVRITAPDSPQGYPASPPDAPSTLPNRTEPPRRSKVSLVIASVLRCLNDGSQTKGVWRLCERNGLAYEYEYTPAFAKWQRLLSPEQYEIVAVRTSRGVSQAMLFLKATQAELEANARTTREAIAIQRERLRAKRAAERAAKQRST